VQRATKYRLLVQDSSQTTVIEEWYTANELESATEGGLWSELLPFDVTAMNGPRWTDNGDNTVLDHTTGIIWAKQTGELDKNGQYPILVRYKRAWHHCNSLNAGERKGWRLPTAWELESVLTELTFELCVDPPPNQFHIPYDHGDIEYWTHNKGEAGGAKWAVIDILS